MSKGITIADLVQQVYYAIYKVRLDVGKSGDSAQYHSKTNKFKEVVMEANLVLQDLQKDADWNWLRHTWDMGHAENFRGVAPQKLMIPDNVYKVCTGYGDGVRIHPHGFGLSMSKTIPYTSPRLAKKPAVRMFDEFGAANTIDPDNRAYVERNFVCFSRPWFRHELGHHLETDVILNIPPLHICDNSCPDHCPKAYDEVLLREMPDPYYLIVKTAAKRAEGDPTVTDRVQSLTDEAAKIMSAMRENDSAHTTPDFWETVPLGYIEVL